MNYNVRIMNYMYLSVFAYDFAGCYTHHGNKEKRWIYYEQLY